MNFAAGLLIYAGLYLPAQAVVVPEIVEFTDCCIFSGDAGLQLGDEILRIDGERVYVNGDITTLLGLNDTGVHDITVRRDGQVLEFRDFAMTHTHEDENGNPYRHYGFGFGRVREATFGGKIAMIWNTTIDNVRMVRLSLQMLFSGRAGIADVTGPVGIVSQMSQVAAESETTHIAMLNLLSMGAFIAINLAVMNLLPLPALDGGRIVCLLITTAVEAVVRKKIDPKYEGYLHMAGMILLLGLMAVIMFKDIFVIFKG